jgi:hypothetical protein
LIPTVLAALSALSSSTSADQTQPAFVQARADTLLAAEYVAQAGGKEEILTNNDVLKMVRARLPESVILQKIRTSTTRFDLSVDALGKLKRAGVSNVVIEAMMGEAPSKPAERAEQAPPPVQPSPTPRTTKATPSVQSPPTYFGDQQFAGKVGVGVQSSLTNFGLGPSVKYYVTDHLAVQGNLGVFGDFTTYGVRGIYQLNKLADIGGIPAYPYAAAGYAKITGPDETYFGMKFTYEGSGFDLLGGLLFDLTKSFGLPVHTSVEFGYSSTELTGSVTYGGKKYDYSYGSWSAFLVGWNLFYNF